MIFLLYATNHVIGKNTAPDTARQDTEHKKSILLVRNFRRPRRKEGMTSPARQTGKLVSDNRLAKPGLSVAIGSKRITQNGVKIGYKREYHAVRILKSSSPAA